MKTVTVKCEHSATRLQLQISEGDFCYIQCQLVQIALNKDQVGKVLEHCQCMRSNLQYDQHRAYLTIDPSQIDTSDYPDSPWVG
jgi:hypothetical protein